MKKFITILIISTLVSKIDAQCMLRPISLQERLTNSSLVIEGKVISEYTRWDDSSRNIYTIHKVQILRYFKGTSTKDTIEFCDMGGWVGNQGQESTNTLHPELGSIGILTLIPTNDPFNSSNNYYEPYAGPQGFIEYHQEDSSAHAVFDSYSNYAGSLLDSIHTYISNSTWVKKNSVSWKSTVIMGAAPGSGSVPSAISTSAVISGFTPTSSYAGRGDTITITITGSGFGATQGTSYVQFRDADQQTSVYSSATVTGNYISWSDTEIKMLIPEFAGTGLVKVTDGTTTKSSSGTLTINYAIINITSSNKDYYGRHYNTNTNGGYSFQFYTGFTNTNARGYFGRAMNDWRCATDMDWDTSTTATTVNTIASDGVNVVRFDVGTELSAGVLGVCTSRFSGCTVSGNTYVIVTELDVCVDDGTSWYYGTGSPGTGNYDYYSMIIHEVGHGHQLGHVMTTTDFMYPAIASNAFNHTISSQNDAGGTYMVGQATSASSNQRCANSVLKAYTCAPSVNLTTSVTSISEATSSFTITATQPGVNSSANVVNLTYSGTATGSGTDYTAATSITIPAWSTSASITVTINNDVLDEDDETIIVDIASLTIGTNGNTKDTVTILDNDATPTVNLSAVGSSVAEAAGTTTVTATPSAVSGRAITVGLTTSGTATGGGTDYTLATSISIPAGAASGSITFTAVQDAIYEGNELAIITLGTLTNVSAGTMTTDTIIITDDEVAPVVTLSSSGATVAEAAGTRTITATQNITSTLTTKVYLSKSGTATNNTDYTLIDSIIIPAGSTSASITLTAVQDAIYEGNETIIIDISSVMNGTENGTQQTTVSIIDDDAIPTVTLSTGTTSIAEAAATTTVTATLSNASSSAVKVYLSKSGTATTATDYTLTDSITIPALSTAASINLTAVQDAIYEGNETVIIDISSVTNGTESGVQQSTVTITDDDAIPSLSMAWSHTSIGETASDTSRLTITQSAVSGLAATASVLAVGSGTLNTDYSLSTTSITIPAGSTTASLKLTVIPDVIYEGNETPGVFLNSVVNATSTSSAYVTINDDDAAPTVTLSTGATSVAEAAGTTTVTATLSAVSGLATKVYLTKTGSATNNTDYTLTDSIIVAAGSSSASITLTAVQDTWYEGTNDSVIITISSVTNGTISGGTQSKTVKITDDDAAPTLTMAWSHTAINEVTSDTSRLTITQSKATQVPTTISISMGGTATSGSDYTMTTTSITIAAGSTSGNAKLTVLNDPLFESTETAIASFGTVVNATGSGTATTTITSEDAAPTVNISSTNTSFSENLGTRTVTVSLSAVSGRSATINLTSGGTATNSTDYSRSATSIVIAAGSTTGTITLTAIQDTMYEGKETVTTSIDSVSNAIPGTTLSVVDTITDDDIAPTVSLSASPISIAEAAGTSTITATLSKVSAVATTINLGGTGTATFSSDYTISSGSITISAGSLTGTTTLTAVQDTIYETKETVILAMAAVTNATSNGINVTDTIVDDDIAPTVSMSVNTSSIAETGGTATITVTQSKATAVITTVNISPNGSSTAVANTDYTYPSSITIPAGSTSATGTIAAVSDILTEPTESIILDISTVTNGTENGVQQTYDTIVDDDQFPTVTLSKSATNIAEAAGTATITATLSATYTAPVIVNLTRTGTAVAGTDYSLGTSITIPTGSMSASITLTSIQDVIYETDEAFNIGISTITNGSANGAQNLAMTIVDDDIAPTVNLSNSGSMAEAAGTSTVTATLSAVSGLTTIVTIGYTGTASITDYTSSPTISIPAGSTTGTATLTATQDILYEGNETVIATISAVTNGSAGATNSTNTSIIDDDTAPTVNLSVNKISITEATDSAIITATISAVSGLTTTVNLTTTGTATLTSDYTKSDSSISIPAGSTTGTVKVFSVQDALFETNETIISSISSVTNGTAGTTSSVTDSIIDDDAAPTVTISVDSGFLNEGNSTQVRVTLNVISGKSTTVYLGLGSTSSFTFPSEYTCASSITIPAGSLTASTTLTSIQDTLYEVIESTYINIDSVLNGTESGTQSVTVTYIDDDIAPVANISASPTSFSEALGTSTVTVTLSKISGFTSNIILSFSGTASSTQDYSKSSSSISIPAGSLSGNITLTAIQDTIYEGNEDITTTIFSVSGGAKIGTILSVKDTIIDDDLAPKVNLTTSTTAINEAAGTATLTATLDKVSALATTVNLTLTGTAKDTTDYSLVKTLTIPAGSISGNLTLTAVQDLIYETTETVIATISSVTNGTVGTTPTQTISITDDETMPTVNLSAIGNTVSEGAGTTTVTATQSGTSAFATKVYLTKSGTATINSDYSLTDSITIPIGSLSGNITLTAIDDTIYEGNETVIVDISSVTNATENGTQQITDTIIENDNLPSVTLSTNITSVSEALGTATVTATLSRASVLATTVNLSMTGTATLATDYSLGNQIVVPAGSISASITLTAIQDLIYEGNETSIIDISTVMNGTENGVQQKTITINDDEVAPSVVLSSSNNLVIEAAGTTTIVATQNKISTVATTVNLTFSGSATNATDYSSGTSIIIPAGDTTASIVLTSTQDVIYELDETVIATISSISNGTIGSPSAQSITIDDDENMPTVSISKSSATINEAAGTSNILATLSGLSKFKTTVQIAKSGLAISGTDYSLGSTIVIYAGTTSANSMMTATQDAIYEGNEKAYIEFTTADSAIIIGTQKDSVTIIDDEAIPTVSLSVGATTITENGGNTTVTATLSAVSGLITKVYLTKSGTATNNTDYTLTDSITIPAGSTSASINLTSINDAITEGDETVIIDISSVINATENGVQQKTVTITEAAITPTVILSVSKTSLTESNDISQVTATLSNSYNQPVTVTIAKTGTATETADYILTNTITIPAGSISGSISLVTQIDGIYEGNETVIIDITAVTNGTENGVQQKTITITDNDSIPKVSLSIGTNIISENNGTTTITATLSKVSSLITTVNLSMSGSASNLDYSSGTQIIIPANQLSASINITSTQDLIYEGDETIIVDISSVTNAIENGVQQKTLTISDDETKPIVNLTTGSSTIIEANGSTTVIVTLSHACSQPVTVYFSISGTASLSLDYTINNSIIIPAGSLIGSTTLTTVQDAIYESNESVIIDIALVTNGIENGVQQKIVTIIDDDVATNSISNSQENLVIIYPNPTMDVVKISSTNIDFQNSEFSLFDLSGKKIMTGKFNQDKMIDLSKLSNGEYQIIVSRNREIILKEKLVKY
jgi:hypothetical protein